MPAPNGILRAGIKTDVGPAVEPIYATDILAAFGVLIKADSENTDDIYVGQVDLNVAPVPPVNGFRLQPGEAIFVEIDNANSVYVGSKTGDQYAHWAVA